MIVISEILTILASSLILSSTFPQTWQTIRTRLTRDISMKFLAVCVAGQAVWTVYAVVTNQRWFILGEGTDMVLWAVVLAIKLTNVIGKKEKVEEKEKEKEKEKEEEKLKMKIEAEVIELTK